MILNDILWAQDGSDVWDLLSPALADLGFPMAMYVYAPQVKPEMNLDPKDVVFYHNIPGFDLDSAIASGQFTLDPIVAKGLAFVGVRMWHDAPVSPQHRRAVIADLYPGTGLEARHGLTISFPRHTAHERGGITLAADLGVSPEEVTQIFATHGPMIEALCLAAHFKLIALPGARGRHLTPRQREVLEWVSAGKTTQEIAQIVGVTPATVEKHMRLARETLEVETTAQAMFKAVRLNQVFSPQEPQS